MSDEKYIYSYFQDFGRMGFLEGLFVAYESEYKSALGREVYFGEALGKHSEVVGKITEDTVKVKEARPEFVAWFEDVVGTVGRDPISTLMEQDAEEREDYE